MPFPAGSREPLAGEGRPLDIPRCAYGGAISSQQRSTDCPQASKPGAVMNGGEGGVMIFYPDSEVNVLRVFRVLFRYFIVRFAAVQFGSVSIGVHYLPLLPLISV